MWSAGCIMAQLINATPQFRGNRDTKDLQKCLFNGDSCYPISPMIDEGSNEEEVNSFSFKDQLGEIMKKLGPLKETDISFIDDGMKRDYVDMFQDHIQKGESGDGKSAY